jgi:proteic killer suppression protein
MIWSFRDKDTQALFDGQTVKRLAGIANTAIRKLDMLDAAKSLIDLRSPPGNRLELLRGDRAGQHSIHINDQWLICFVWNDDGAHAVEIAEYH